MNVVALLPYLAEHYDEPSTVCIEAAVSVADVSHSFTDDAAAAAAADADDDDDDDAVLLYTLSQSHFLVYLHSQ